MYGQCGKKEGGEAGGKIDPERGGGEGEGAEVKNWCW